MLKEATGSSGKLIQDRGAKCSCLEQLTILKDDMQPIAHFLLTNHAFYCII